MGAAGAAQVLAFRAVGQSVVPGVQLQSGLAATGVERRRTLVGGDPPLLFHACLLFAADVARETFNPGHRVLCHPVGKIPSCFVAGELISVARRDASRRSQIEIWSLNYAPGSPLRSRLRQASSGSIPALSRCHRRVKIGAGHPSGRRPECPASIRLLRLRKFESGAQQASPSS